MEEIKTKVIELEKELEEISSTLFGDEGIVAWAKNHIEAEKERKEIYKELRKKLAVRGVLGAFSILLFLVWLGFKSFITSGGKL